MSLSRYLKYAQVQYSYINDNDGIRHKHALVDKTNHNDAKPKMSHVDGSP